jgi:hypothetical protein
MHIRTSQQIKTYHVVDGGEFNEGLIKYCTCSVFAGDVRVCENAHPSSVKMTIRCRFWPVLAARWPMLWTTASAACDVAIASFQEFPMPSSRPSEFGPANQMRAQVVKASADQQRFSGVQNQVSFSAGGF